MSEFTSEPNETIRQATHDMYKDCREYAKDHVLSAVKYVTIEDEQWAVVYESESDISDEIIAITRFGQHEFEAVSYLIFDGFVTKNDHVVGKTGGDYYYDPSAEIYVKDENEVLHLKEIVKISHQTV